MHTLVWQIDDRASVLHGGHSEVRSAVVFGLA